MTLKLSVSPLLQFLCCAVRQKAFLPVVMAFLLINSASAQVTIKNQPVSQTISSGGNAVFTVVADSKFPLFYQWKHNGIFIPGATDNTYAVSKATLADAGSYNVVVYNPGVGSVPTFALDSAAASLVLGDLSIIPLTDKIVDAPSLSTSSGVGRGSNVGAGIEPGEPDPDGTQGGASVWIKWSPEVNGIGTLSTAGSGFDTLLAVYTKDGKGGFQPVVGDDDGLNFLNSTVSFNMSSSGIYYIQIDGFYGQTGNIILKWSAVSTTDRLPVVLVQPTRQVVAPKSDVTLTFDAQAAKGVAYQWYFNGSPILHQTASTLHVSDIGNQNVGIYYCTATSSQEAVRTITSRPVTIQTHTSDSVNEGADIFAENKFRFTTDPASMGQMKLGGNGKLDAPASGFTGAQIFSTYGSAKEPGEPNHCGEAGGSSYWLSYTPPMSGTLNIDTKGSSFDTVLAIYTWPGTGGFASLVPIACSDKSSGTSGESVTFSATSGTTYYIVVDGVGGATGTVHLNYVLTSPPTLGAQPVSQTATNGANVSLMVAASGRPTLAYQWLFNGSNISGANSTIYVVNNFQAASQGAYSVLVSNPDGSVPSTNAMLYLNNPLRVTNSVMSGNSYSTRVLGIATTNYIFQVTSNLVDWVSLQTNSSPYGIVNFSDSNITGKPMRFYRVKRK